MTEAEAQADAQALIDDAQALVDDAFEAARELEESEDRTPAARLLRMLFLTLGGHSHHLRDLEQRICEIEMIIARRFGDS